jgi:hypothetical protein
VEVTAVVAMEEAGKEVGGMEVGRKAQAAVATEDLAAATEVVSTAAGLLGSQHPRAVQLCNSG